MNNTIIVKQAKDKVDTFYFDYKGFRTVLREDKYPPTGNTYWVGTVFSAKHQPFKSIPSSTIEQVVKAIVQIINESQP